MLLILNAHCKVVFFSYVALILTLKKNNLALNLTGHTVLAQIRKTYGSTTSTSFTTAIDSDPSTGKVTISLTDTQTTALEEGRYVYDVLITNSSGIKTRAVQGIATVSPSVSRS